MLTHLFLELWDVSASQGTVPNRHNHLNRPPTGKKHPFIGKLKPLTISGKLLGECYSWRREPAVTILGPVFHRQALAKNFDRVGVVPHDLIGAFLVNRRQVKRLYAAVVYLGNPPRAVKREEIVLIHFLAGKNLKQLFADASVELTRPFLPHGVTYENRGKRGFFGFATQTRLS